MFLIFHIKNTLRFWVFCLVIAGCFLLPIRGVSASSPSGLRDLAKSFVQSLSPIYAGVEKEDSGQILSQIPDNTTLLLKPQIDKLQYFSDVYSIKKGNKIYLSLVDVIQVFELAIDFDEETGLGEGWFLREDWPIVINVPEREVVSRGRVYRIAEDDLIREDGLDFVSGRAIGAWMDMAFEYDLSQQYMFVDSAYPLPAVAKDARRRRKEGVASSKNVAVLPRMEADRALARVDAVDVNAGVRYNRSSSGNANRRFFTNAAAQGQLFNHDAYVFANRDSEEGLRQVTTRFSRQSETPDLLGPLRARYYEFGDVNATNVPLTGSVQQSVGMTVNNNPLVNADFNVTDIEGDSLPGWDVELYRNGISVDVQTVGDSGRYEFADVPLFSGDNSFEVFFYGPQGEIRREALEIPVTEALLRTQSDTYELSMNLEERRSYESNPLEDPDRDKVHIAGRYNKMLGESLGYAGFRSRSIEGERKSFVSAGVTHVQGPAIIDANVAVDDQLNAAAELGVRGKVRQWDLAFNTAVSGDEFVTDENDDPVVLNTSVRAQRSFDSVFGPGRRANVFAHANYRQTANDTEFTRASLGVSQQIHRMNLSNTLSYEKSDAVNVQDERLENSFAVRGNFGKAFVRAGFAYDFAPESRIDRYFSQINYRHDSQKNADLIVEHDPDRDFSRGRLSLNYTHDYFRTSPFVEVNSDDSVFAGMNVNFNLLNPLHKDRLEVTSKRLIGRGLVTGFVYHDANGNFVFDEGEEPLPDVLVKSVNSTRRVQTDVDGYAVLKDMPVTRPTDIVIDEGTLPDPFMISAVPGSSVFPVAGQHFKLDFPVHMAGEVDGTVYLRGRDGDKKAFGNGVVALMSLDDPARETLTAKVAFDGFFLLTKIPPGRYLMTVRPVRGRRAIGNVMPAVVEIGHDGTILYGRDIMLVKGAGFVPYEVRFAGGVEHGDDELVSSYQPASYRSVLTLRKKGGFSELAGLVRQFLMKRHADSLLAALEPVGVDGDGHEQYQGAPDMLHNTCSVLNYYQLDCVITVMPDPVQVAVLAEG